VETEEHCGLGASFPTAGPIVGTQSTGHAAYYPTFHAHVKMDSELVDAFFGSQPLLRSTVIRLQIPTTDHEVLCRS